MTTHELGRRLLKLPKLEVSSGNKHQVGSVHVHWMHVLNDREFTWCQGSKGRRSKNCFACNQGWRRLRVAIIEGKW